MQDSSLVKRLTAESLGTAILLVTIVGSGIMAERLADGNEALALLGNTLSTGAMLVVLIMALAPFSGAHFNPAVTLVFLVRREVTLCHAGLYCLVQILGAVMGTMLAHAMFDLPLHQTATQIRTGQAQWLSEGVATFGLILTILAVRNHQPDKVPLAVGLYIVAAYWFTASTSFANPAVTLARTLTDSFSGIRLVDAFGFMVMQCASAIGTAFALRWFLDDRHPRHSE